MPSSSAFQARGRSPPSSPFFFVFIFILAVLLGITTVLLVEISNLEKSGALSSLHFTAIIQEMDALARNALPGWAYDYVSVIILKNVQEISDIPVAIATWLFPIVQRKLSSLASNLPVLFAQLIVVIFFTYYILMDGQAFVAGGMDLIPKQKQRIM
jgi:predicted PurR-regulated permease PerM